MLRFYIAFENTDNEQIYDDKHKTIVWTNKLADKDSPHGKIKFLEDVKTDVQDGTWRPIGYEILAMFGDTVLMADIPNQFGEVYDREALKIIAVKDPDNWKYSNGVLYKVSK